MFIWLHSDAIDRSGVSCGCNTWADAWPIERTMLNLLTATIQ